ncbi:hypothetical protein BUALT_Bualt09G0105600 [Buddleja alternifolia]|uniref:Uncharacterized protein n=1 Tax=Buddleja alternifolia TaxID=168488 RepID=A0AAV6X374_9LAMI|nr:hypothetical protein BUALT_Bualt09G0105600 [Buddleja alternifolia]
MLLAYASSPFVTVILPRRQRSSNCPICWQSISLKDPSSQELLEAVERERGFRITPSRNATIFHHSTLGDFELQHVSAICIVLQYFNNIFTFAGIL